MKALENFHEGQETVYFEKQNLYFLLNMFSNEAPSKYVSGVRQNKAYRWRHRKEVTASVLREVTREEQRKEVSKKPRQVEMRKRNGKKGPHPDAGTRIGHINWKDTLMQQNL